MPAAPNAQQIANSLTPDNLMDQLSTMQDAINAQYIPTQPPPSLLNQPLNILPRIAQTAPASVGTSYRMASPYGAWSSDIARMAAGMQPGSVSVSRNRPSAGFSNMVSGKDKYGHDVQSYTDRSGTQHLFQDLSAIYTSARVWLVHGFQMLSTTPPTARDLCASTGG